METLSTCCDFFFLSKDALKILSNRSRSSTRTSADTIPTDPLTLVSIVDREFLWAKIDGGEDSAGAPDALDLSQSESEETEVEEEEQEEERKEEEEEEESEHTESADTSGAQASTEESSSSPAPCRASEDSAQVNGLRRIESERTQASDSLSSDDEEDLELEAMARSRLLKQERERRDAIDSLFRHVLLYPAATGGWRHLLQGLSLLDSLLKRSSECPLVDALCCTSLDTSSAAHLNLVSNLLQRHQQAQEGHGFYGPLLSPCAGPFVLIELLVSLCLRFMRSHYPSYVALGPLDQRGNREAQVKSVEVLTHVVNQLVNGARRQERITVVRRLLSTCRVQEFALLTLSASMYVSQRGADKAPTKCTDLLAEQGGLSEESLVNLGGGPQQYPLQMELLKLLQALIVLEYHVLPTTATATATPAVATPSGTGAAPSQRNASVPSTPLAREWQTAMHFQKSIKAAQYVQSHPITEQGMFVSAAARALQPQYGFAMHPHWVSLLCSSLPYLGRSLSIVVAPLVAQICRNLDELVRLYEHDGGKSSQR